MNVAFFLTPKSEVAWVPLHASIREVLEQMQKHRFSAVPILDPEGRYVGTLTEGDLLWKLRSLGSREAESEVFLADVPRRFAHRSVEIDAQVERLLSLAADQNFIPVVDSRDVFIGIVRRKAILEHCARLLGERFSQPP
jgi:CBS domain-containing protein